MRRLAVLIVCAFALPVSVAKAWTWPVDGPVLRGFSFDRAHPYAGGQHRGLDIGSPAGAQVHAPAAGVVSFAGTVPTGGRTVSIQSPSGYTATLVHLGSIGVKRGESVAEGSAVGTVGPSGVVDLTEPFVYFGVRLTADEQGYVDPLPLLPSRTPPTARPEAPVAAASAPASPAVPVAPPIAADPPAPSAQDPSASAGETGSGEASAEGTHETASNESTGAVASNAEPAAPSAANVLEVRAGLSEQVGSRTRARWLHPESGGHTVVEVRRATSARPTSGERAATLAPAVHRAVAADAKSGVETGPLSISAKWHLLRSEAATSAKDSSGGEAPSHRASERGAAMFVPAAMLVAVLAGLIGAWLWLRRHGARRREARIMSLPELEPVVGGTQREAEDPGRAGLAVCVGEEAPGPRGGVCGPGRHLRAVPPPEGQRCPDGERDRRARDAGHGRGRSRGRLAA